MDIRVHPWHTETPHPGHWNRPPPWLWVQYRHVPLALAKYCHRWFWHSRTLAAVGEVGLVVELELEGDPIVLNGHCQPVSMLDEVCSGWEW